MPPRKSPDELGKQIQRNKHLLPGAIAPSYVIVTGEC